MLFHPLRSPFPEQRHPLTMFPSDIRHIILTPHKTGQTYNTKKQSHPLRMALLLYSSYRNELAKAFSPNKISAICSGCCDATDGSPSP